MSHDFEELMDEIEQEARRGGPRTSAEYAAFGAHYRLAREIFDLRKAAGLTQRQLAASSGVQQADISRIEAGDANPTLATIAALAYALGAEVTLERRADRKAVGERQRRASKRPASIRRPVAAAARMASTSHRSRGTTPTR
ncbi:MAG TPA: helix-turn-helix domain-containing protein [Anaeromyxobacter sp.]